jgi:phospholipase/carboxylesterase
MNKITFHHIVRKPKKNDGKPPLLLMVHGFGSNEEDLFSFSRNLPDQLMIVSIRGPIEMQGMGYAWYNISIDHLGNKVYDIEKAIESRNDIVKCIEYCTKKYDTDPNNVTLLGFSQGSILINAVALTYPEKVKNIISLSGGFDRNIIQLSKSSFNNLSFYVSHGTDDMVLPYDQAKKTIEILKENNISFQFESYHVGHGVCPENFKSLLLWLNNNL